MEASYAVASLQEMGIAPKKKIILFSYCLRKSCKQCPILLYERLRQRQRYFDVAQYKSVQVPNAQRISKLLFFS
ncbi:MAG: hypothetical protein ACYTXY_17445 [Nostoc sp.]